ncbi:helix-turn-helix domain-containing protein [Staphylococcus capitis]|uniref:helix-turn-helix domain-containing protein n=1 Tax=Staphylococcus capitis TaxID=29388 RepID=UPI0021A9542D|nr:helix-turn-helix domain-containing protein [Staphylococcus capitis]MCT2013750.1 helix-turn-helix domain-containing protein [Staphylococcus capitis]
MDNAPILLTRQQAAEYLGIDPKSFDKYIRNQPDFKSFMLGKQERFVKSKIIEFIEKNCIE